MGTTFTHDLSKPNRTNGLNLLRIYFQNSVISKAPYYPVATNFDGMVKYLDKNYPTYIEYLGSLYKDFKSSDLEAAVKSAAKRGLTDYPRPAYFSNELIKISGYSALQAGLDGAADAAAAVGNFTIGLGKTVWVLSVLGLLIVLYLEFGAPAKAIFKKIKGT